MSEIALFGINDEIALFGSGNEIALFGPLAAAFTVNYINQAGNTQNDWSGVIGDGSDEDSPTDQLNSSLVNGAVGNYFILNGGPRLDGSASDVIYTFAQDTSIFVNGALDTSLSAGESMGREFNPLVLRKRSDSPLEFDEITVSGGIIDTILAPAANPPTTAEVTDYAQMLGLINLEVFWSPGNDDPTLATAAERFDISTTGVATSNSSSPSASSLVPASVVPGNPSVVAVTLGEIDTYLDVQSATDGVYYYNGTDGTIPASPPGARLFSYIGGLTTEIDTTPTVVQGSGGTPTLTRTGLRQQNAITRLQA